MKGWSGSLAASVEAATSAAAAAQATADAALEDAALVWVEVVFSVSALGAVSPATVNVVAPVTGTLETLAISSTGASSAAFTCAATIGGAAVTGGSVQQQANDPAGTVRTATATAANAVTALETSVLLTFTAGGTTALRSTVLVGFRRS